MSDKWFKKLRWGLLGAMAVCLLLFLAVNLLLSQRVERSANQVSGVYMTSMSAQLRQKFSLAVELTQEKIDGVINRNPPAESAYGQELLESLRTSAWVRSFIYLGFLCDDGELVTIYGEDTNITGGERALETLSRSGSMVETGMTASGERCLLLGRAAGYPLEDGTRSAALVAGVSVEYMSSLIFESADSAILFSHIIDREGNCILHPDLPGVTSQNYFEYVRGLRGLAPEDAEAYIQGLKDSIQGHTEYAAAYTVDGEPRRVYFMPLQENSAWYLISVMPAGFVDEAITQLDWERTIVMAAAFLVVLTILLLFFLWYSRASRQQMRRLDEARAEADQANQFKSAFLSSMSHDIRTPMNAIVGMSEIATRNLDDRERVEDCLQKVKLSSKQLLGLINDILDISKIESGKMTLHIEELSLRDEMNDIVGITQSQIKARDQKFDIFIRDILSEHVWCDSVRLSQILLNLLSNAIKFTPEGGSIEVRLWQEPSPKGEEYVRTHFKVDDTGIGMTPEFQKKIFENFERETSTQVHHTTGSGLGTSIVKRIVDLMEGTIELHSELGKGSSFHVTLDLKKATAQVEMKLPPWNILVIDDSEPLCVSAAANLEELGTHADWALSCGEAVEKVEKHHKQGKDYHFILVDWDMPIVNGLQTIRELRSRVGAQMPIYLISAYDWGDIQDKLEEEEIAGFISKPLFVSTLYERLSQYVSGESVAPVVPETPDLSGRRVLLAEDNDLNWEVAEALLSESGLALDHAENGKICVDMFTAAQPGYYDAILMDVRMPVMDGYEATRHIRALDRPDRDLPIIAMTADSFSEDVQKSMECGMNHHLSKPLDFRECVNVLQRYLK